MKTKYIERTLMVAVIVGIIVMIFTLIKQSQFSDTLYVGQVWSSVDKSKAHYHISVVEQNENWTKYQVDSATFVVVSNDKIISIWKGH